MPSTASANTTTIEAAAASGRPFFVRCFGPRLSSSARPGLLLLAAVLLVGLSTVLTGRHGRRPANSAEFDLLTAPSSSKLNNTSAAAPEPSARALQTEPESPSTKAKESEPLPAVAPAESKVPHLVPVQAPEIAPLSAEGLTKLEVGPVPGMESEPLVNAPVGVQPAPETSEFIRTLHEGDSPMMRNWKMFGLTSALAAALAAAPPAGNTAQAVDQEKNATETLLNQLRKDVKDLKKSLDEFKGKVGADMNAAQASTNLAFQRTGGDIQDLKKQVADLRKDLDDLKKRLATTTTAAYGPSEVQTGRVLMINDFPQPMTIFVNRRAYRLNAFEHRLSDPIPAGRFTYEILRVTGNDILRVTEPRTRTVAANGIFRFTIYPQGG